MHYYKGISNISPLTYLDVSHSVISDVNFDKSNWKKLASRYVYSIITENSRLKTVPIEAIEEVYFQVKWPCYKCEQDYFQDKFRHSHRICDKCYRELNRDKLNENIRRFRKQNPNKYKERNSFYSKKYNEKNKEKVKAYKAAWFQKNKERLRDKKNENNNS